MPSPQSAKIDNPQARASLPDDVETLKALVLQRDTEIEQLKLLVAKLKRMQFGRSSERLDREVEQLELRLEELQTQAELNVVRAATHPEKRKPIRQPLPEHLPREQVVHTPACTCPECGAPMRQIGADIAEVLDYCHLSAYWSQLVSGIKAPANFRRNGATAFSAYWSQRVFGVMEPVVGSTGISD